MVKNIFKEKIINCLIDRKITDINSFLIEFKYLTTYVYKPDNKNHSTLINRNDIKYGDTIYTPKDDKILILYLKQFVSFWDKLEQLGYIHTIPHSKQNNKLIPIVKKESLSERILKQDSDIFTIVEKHLDKEIVPDIEELENFVKNNYLTITELAYKKEKRDRKTSQKITIIIAIISMLTAIVTSYFNYKSNTNEIEVTLKKATLSDDTLKVILINSDSLSKK